MLYETNLLTTTPILRSVRCIVSELFFEAFHATLYSFVCRRHVINQYAGRQSTKTSVHFALKRLRFVHEINTCV